MKKNPHGTRIERENALAQALGMGTGRTMMGAMISAYESGAIVSVEFYLPDRDVTIRSVSAKKGASDEKQS